MNHHMHTYTYIHTKPARLLGYSTEIKWHVNNCTNIMILVHIMSYN